MITRARAQNKLLLFSGRLVDVFNLKDDDIAIEDIGHALANKPHWNGHARFFFSIAQHSIDVCNLCMEHSTEAALFGLLHDAAEAYLFDAARPIKQSVCFYETTSGYNTSEPVTMKDMEQRILSRIWARFLLPSIEPEIVKWCDDISLVSEWRDLMPHNGWNPWPGITPYSWKCVHKNPNDVEKEFIRVFSFLQSERANT